MPAPGHGSPGAALGPRVGPGPLASHREASSVTQASISSYVYQPPYVHVHLAPEVTLNPLLSIDDLSDAGKLLISQVPHSRIADYSGLPDNVRRLSRANPVDATQRNLDPLVVRNVDTGHYRPSVALLRLDVLISRQTLAIPVSAYAADSCKLPASFPCGGRPCNLRIASLPMQILSFLSSVSRTGAHSYLNL